MFDKVHNPVLKLLLSLGLLAAVFAVVGMHYVHHVHEYNLKAQLAAAKACDDDRARHQPAPGIPVFL